MWLAFLLCIIYRSLLMLLLLLPFRSMMDSCCVVSSDLHTPGERRWRIHGIPRIQQPEDPRIGPMRSWPWSPCIRAHSSEFAQLGEAHFHFVEVVLVGMVYLSFENSSHHPSHKTSIPSLSSLPMPFFFHFICLNWILLQVPVEPPSYPEFKNMRALILRNYDPDGNFQTLGHFLQSSPILEKLTLQCCKVQ